jgi:hypothetical protein
MVVTVVKKGITIYYKEFKEKAKKAAFMHNLMQKTVTEVCEE